MDKKRKIPLSDYEKYALELTKILLANTEIASSIDVCDLDSAKLISKFNITLTKKFLDISIKPKTIEILKVLCANEKAVSSLDFNLSTSVEGFLSFVESLNNSL